MLSRLFHLAGYWNVTWVPWSDPIFAKCPYPNACSDNSSLRPLHTVNEYALADNVSSSGTQTGHESVDRFVQDDTNSTDASADVVQMTNCVPTTGGPLCAVCNVGHYRANRIMPGCTPCTGGTTLMRVGIICLVVACILTPIYAFR